MATANQVLTALRNELVAAGIVRKPSAAGPLPPMHVEPDDGAPAPGEREAPEDDATLVITLTLSGELGETVLDAYRRRVVVDVRYRSRSTAGLKRARDVDAAIRTRLVSGRPDYGLGWNLDENGAAPVFVLSSQVFAGLGRISATAASGYDEVAKYMLEVHA